MHESPVTSEGSPWVMISADIGTDLPLLSRQLGASGYIDVL